MKSLIFSIFMLAGSMVIADSNPLTTSNIDVEKSTIEWTGKKVTGKHTGNVDIKSGELEFENGRLSGGKFVIDMTSITNTDMEGNMSDKLVGHLKSDDFFSVATYPEAMLEITKVSGAGNGNYNVTADLTIKGKTHPVTFEVTENGNTYTSSITVDRTLYDVRYGSGKFFEGLGDKMIYDDFTLDVSLVKS